MMLNWKKWLVLTLSSLWLWPVSCTTATIAAMRMQQQNIHFIQPGEAIHPYKFSLLVFPEQNQPAFKRIPYSAMASYPASAFRAPATSGVQERGGENREGYTVQAQSDTFQTIEVMKQGDTQTLWSTYQLSASGITPISTREFNIGAVILGIYAAVLATLIYGLGRWLRRRFVEIEY